MDPLPLIELDESSPLMLSVRVQVVLSQINYELEHWHVGPGVDDLH